jgi:hypothetical protein
MTAASVEPQPWGRRRWLAGVLAILAGQLGFIFWLGAPRPAALASVNFGPKVYLPANPREEWPGLDNPALFVLPNRHGFSGAAWVQFQTPGYDPQNWTEPPRPLPLAIAQLGGSLAEYARTNLASTFELVPKPEPQFEAVVPDENLGVARSTLTVEGELAKRPLLSKFQLPSWPGTEILTNSEVLVGVDRRGNVLSSVLVETKGSGSKEADAAALKLAASARFKPLRWTGPGQLPDAENRLSWGRLIFHWNTIPMPATNAPAGNF